jgi:hypothetical protein
MSKLEQLTPNAAVRGILPDGLVTVVSVQWASRRSCANSKRSDFNSDIGPAPHPEIVARTRAHGGTAQ